MPLFFVISGFVISSSAEGKTARAFVVGRLLRLYPTFVLCMTISALILFPATGTPPWNGIQQYLANLTFYPGLLGLPFIDSVYWTLAPEVEFYAAMAALLLFGIGSRTALWHPVWVAGIVLAAALHLSALFPLFGTYFAYFAAGAIIFDIRRHGVSLLRGGMLGVLAAVTVSFSVRESNGLSVIRAHALSGWAVLVIIASFYFAFLAFEVADARGWRLPSANLLGLMTFALYLLHARLGYYTFWLLGGVAIWQTTLSLAILFTGLAMLIAGVIEPAMRPTCRSAIERVVRLILPQRPLPVLWRSPGGRDKSAL